jgi:biopolymer transport protein TolR
MTVVQVMGAMNAGGFSNIGLVTDIGGPTFDGTNSAGSNLLEPATDGQGG